MPRVNPEILRWARETAGLSVEEAARKLGMRDTRAATASERLRSLERGEDTPSRPLIVKMAQSYRRPLLVFYLSTVPPTGRRGQDLRSLVDRSAGQEAILDALIRSVHARQSLVRAAMEDDEDATPLPFVGSMSLKDGEAAVLASIRAALRLNLDDFRGASDATTAFGLLRNRVESVGVFVVLQGNLGTYHTALSVETFRGFALADPVAPFVVINDEDARTAWSFTLLHELVHIWLGQTAISGGPPRMAIEIFCNNVASEFLVSSGEINALDIRYQRSVPELRDQISHFANQRRVSRSMVAYRLYLDDKITEEEWIQLRGIFRRQWLDSRRQQRRQARETEGGPDYYVVRRHRLGPGLLETAARLLSAKALPSSKVAQVLAVKPYQLPVLLGFGTG